MILFENVIFDKSDCDYLINNASDFVQSGYKAGIGKVGYNLKKRNSFVSKQTLENTNPIFKKIETAFNSIGYSLLVDKLNIELYKYNKGNFIAKHIDSDLFEKNRFCVCVGQLSIPTNYLGGQFNSYIKDKKIPMSKELGNFLIITPEIVHEVEVVEDGERISLILAITNSEIKAISKKSII
jgi:hypothetical protein